VEAAGIEPAFHLSIAEFRRSIVLGILVETEVMMSWNENSEIGGAEERRRLAIS